MSLSYEEKISLGRKFNDAVFEEDRETFLRVTADEINIPGRLISQGELWDHLQRNWRDPFSEITHNLEQVICDGDFLSWRFSFTGMHDSGPLYGIPPTGNRVETQGHTFARIEGGEIAEAVALEDVLSIFQTLDIVPETTHEMQFQRELRQVLLRILRHNIRNDLTTIAGYAEMIASEDDVDPEHGQRILENVEDLRGTAEKIRSIEQQIVHTRGSGSVDPTEIVAGVLSNLRTEFPGADMSLSVPEGRLNISAQRDILEVVIEEAIRNAVVHANRSDPCVEVSLEAHDGQGHAASITVADDGPGIPQHELQPLTRGREDPLDHGSGIGLWAMKWGMDRLEGELEIEAGESQGTTVKLHI